MEPAAAAARLAAKGVGGISDAAPAPGYPAPAPAAGGLKAGLA